MKKPAHCAGFFMFSDSVYGLKNVYYVKFLLKSDKYEQQYRTTACVSVYVKRGHYALSWFYSFDE